MSKTLWRRGLIMNKFHFQVVCMDRKAYILSYDNFEWDQIDKMMKHVEYKSTDGNVSKIEITRWNKITGERE